MPYCVICKCEVSKGSFNVKDKFELSGGGFICKACAGKIGVKNFMAAGMLTEKKALKKYYDLHPEEAPNVPTKEEEAEADKAFIEKINAIPDCKIILVNELKYLRRALNEGEDVLHVVNGIIRKDSFALFDSRNVIKMSGSATESWIAALTESRILLVNKHLLAGTDCISIPLESVNVVSYQTGVMESSITIMHGVSGIVMEHINKGYAKPFADKANEALKNLSNSRNASAHGNTGNAPVSVADELVKLKGLLDAGVLTQEEFDTQKAKLLR